MSGYIHCPDCVKEVNNIEGESPRNYARYEICLTKKGIEASCIRHEKKFYSFDINEFLEFMQREQKADEDKKAEISAVNIVS